ncbi:PotD/PotF family extracellular solute-binding protein [Haloarchaeobius sp. HME9146]|uniref:ABC transporter substrate-binding protein n=1 Tax=Haloarchaeobius sp. HME9146 TaxID=2978732 RepID=UPI0021BEBD4A|nr:PotD/PotF family extracellular solute-binding protein [Haloarchaeobius sp. HME9146]MCT9098090.1 PotD/PotF family extracellular solute-binding protein [Haloarchaeobius sp. HME9146]
MVANGANSDSEPNSSRRGFLKSAGLTATVTAGLGGCLGGGGSGGSGSTDSNGTTVGTAGDKLADKITFYSTGGSWARKMDEALLKPFQEETGVTVNLQTYGNPSTMLSKIKAGQADVDAMLMTDPPLYQGIVDDIWAPLRTKNIPNIDRLRTLKPSEVPYDQGEEIHHVPNTYGAYGLVYNTNEVSSEPKKWEDIYNSNLKGNLSLSQFTSSVVGTAALDLGYDINEFASDDAKVEDVWNRVKKQHEHSYQWWDSATTAQQLYTNNSALAGNFWVGRTRVLNNENDVPVKYTLPEDGAVGYASVWAVNSNIDDPKRYTCERLLNYVLADEPSRRLAEIISYAQANEISNPPESYKTIPDNQHPDRIKLWDQEVFSNNQKEWSQKFQQIARSN